MCEPRVIVHSQQRPRKLGRDESLSAFLGKSDYGVNLRERTDFSSDEKPIRMDRLNAFILSDLRDHSVVWRYLARLGEFYEELAYRLAGRGTRVITCK